jgi:predicted secreted protein
MIIEMCVLLLILICSEDLRKLKEGGKEMASNAVSGVGTVFNRWSGSDWEALAEVNSITGPTMTRSFIDVTSLDSIGGYREFITGFRDAGTISLKMNFTAVTYRAMKADFESVVAQNYEVVLPDETRLTLEFEGLVTEIPLSIPTDDKITADVTIKITGKVEISDNSGGSSGI